MPSMHVSLRLAWGVLLLEHMRTQGSGWPAPDMPASSALALARSRQPQMLPGVKSRAMFDWAYRQPTRQYLIQFQNNVIPFSRSQAVTSCAGGQVVIEVGLRNARLPRLPGAPPELQALVGRCTAPEAAVRPSFAEVAAQLAALQAGFSPTPGAARRASSAQLAVLQAAAPAGVARRSSSGPLRIAARGPRPGYGAATEARGARYAPAPPARGTPEPGSVASSDGSYWRRWGVLRGE